jgi:hypothetical protein
MSTEYEGLDLSQMLTEYERVSAESTNASSDDYLEKFVKLPEKQGNVVLRFMPIKKGQKFFCVTRVHTLTNPNTKRKRAYHCRRQLVQTDRVPKWMGDCIICKYYSDLWQKSEGLSGKQQEDLQNQARAIKPVERYYYNVIVRQQKNKDGVVENNVGPKIYSCGKNQHAKITRAIVGDEVAGDKPLGDITHPINGRDFKVVKKIVKGGGGMEYPNYDDSKFEDPSPLGTKEEISRWLEATHDLQALRVVKDPEELKQALRVHLGMVKEDEAKNDDDLEEFRTVGQAQPQASASASTKIKEEVIVSSPESNDTPGEENDLLADDEFMRELGAM